MLLGTNQIQSGHKDDMRQRTGKKIMELNGEEEPCMPRALVNTVLYGVKYKNRIRRLVILYDHVSGRNERLPMFQL